MKFELNGDSDFIRFDCKIDKGCKVDKNPTHCFEEWDIKLFSSLLDAEDGVSIKKPYYKDIVTFIGETFGVKWSDVFMDFNKKVSKYIAEYFHFVFFQILITFFHPIEQVVLQYTLLQYPQFLIHNMLP